MNRQSVSQRPQPILATAGPVSGILQRACGCGRHRTAGAECPQCRAKREGSLRRAAVNSDTSAVVPAVVAEVLRSPGRPLEPATRRFMESRFDTDFSRVRVHTDAKAAESAHLLDAQAYAVGRHIVFGSGYFDPATARGRRLLAHELAHVVQQDFQDPPATTELAVAPPADRYEREAQAAAAQIAGGGPTTPIHAANAGLGVQKQSEAEQLAAQLHPFCVCGPNVSAQVKNVLLGPKYAFDQMWTDDQKEKSCEALVSLSTGLQAWDIIELHFLTPNNRTTSWLLDYQPQCATECPTATHGCEDTVQVDSNCHQHGAVNYVIFGVMCKLCYDYYDQQLQSNPDRDFKYASMFVDYSASEDRDAFSEDAMEELIWLYKGVWRPHLSWDWGAAPNYDDSVAWAEAGYNGWPGSGVKTPSSSIRSQCSPTCPTAYGSLSTPDSPKGPFSWHWKPYKAVY